MNVLVLKLNTPNSTYRLSKKCLKFDNFINYSPCYSLTCVAMLCEIGNDNAASLHQARKELENVQNYSHK